MNKLFDDVTTFDFRSKRVKMDGKSMSKFSIAYVVKLIDYWKGLYIDEVYTYDECKNLLFGLLKDKAFSNVVVYE